MISLIPKKINGVKAFAVDIDGTLTENGNGLVHLPAVSKLRFLERSGYKVVFVTGRSAIEAYILFFPDAAIFPAASFIKSDKRIPAPARGRYK